MTENKEVWRNVAGHEGFEISNHGRLRKSGSIVKTHLSAGYPAYCFHRPRDYQRIHRLVAVAFLPNPGKKPQVNHLDGVKTNNHADNLEWVTAGENILHARENGLLVSPVGESTSAAKLTRKQVVQIRKKAHNTPIKELAAIYGMDQGHMSRIVRGKKWKHLPVEEYKYSPGKGRAVPDERILNFWDMLIQGNTLEASANKAGISNSLGSRVANRKAYQHLTNDLPDNPIILRKARLKARNKEIMDLLSTTKMTKAEIAKKYGISEAMVFYIEKNN